MTKPGPRDDLERFTWQSSCFGKHKYPNGAQAFRAANQIIDAGRGFGGRKLASYRCRHCNAWHVGNTERTIYFRHKRRPIGKCVRGIWDGVDLEIYSLDP